MIMWLIIFILVFAAVFAGLIYLINRIRNFNVIKKAAKDKNAISWLISTAIVIIPGAVLVLCLNMTNAFVCFLHLISIWIILDIAGYVLRRFFNKDVKKYIGITAFAITIVILCFGWYFAHHVFRTAYEINTDKNVQKLRIVHFADSHIGTTFHAEKLREHVQKMQSENPDIVLITGDFVDDDTSREDMLSGCEALSLFDAKYGVYFSYGNHDRGYMDEQIRGWTNAEFENALKESGVKILEDEAAPVEGNYCILGRADLSSGDRLSMDEFIKSADNEAYTIVLDHQPSDYDAQEESGVDLVLSGHTHGGQLIPITYVGEWIGVNDKTYGFERRSNTDFIVTSGISDWAIKFKTGCKAEYVVIDISHRD